MILYITPIMLELIENELYIELLNYLTLRAGIILVCWVFVVISAFVDFWSGVNTAKAVGEKISSRGFRRTITKIGDYIRVLIFAMMIDILGSFLSFYVLPFATILGAIAVVLIEGKSVIENARRKKSHAAEVPELVKKIVQAATTKDAEKIIDAIKNAK